MKIRRIIAAAAVAISAGTAGAAAIAPAVTAGAATVAQGARPAHIYET